MKMVIGGANQGQLEWAKEQYKIEKWLDGTSCALDEIDNCDGIYDFHQYIFRVLKEDKEGAGTLAKRIISNNPGTVIVSDEIGYGLVPVDNFDRMYREKTGRICTELAAFSEEVTRVVMGIGVRIK